MTIRCTAVLSACAVACCIPAPAFGDITITVRDSVAENDVLVGAGGFIDRSDVRETETAFTGPLMLNDSASVEVTSDDPFSNGDGTGTTAMVFMDNVTQPSADELRIEASGDATATVTYIDGGALGSFRHDMKTRVRFTVSDDLVAYCISGDWNPDPDTVSFTTEIELARIFFPSTFKLTGATGAFSATGVLEPGDYEFNARVNSNDTMSDTFPLVGATSSYNFVIEFFPYVPCAADVVVDGEVDLDDLLLVLANFGTMTDEGDTDGNNTVDLTDLLTVLAEFGTSCLPCAQP